MNLHHNNFLRNQFDTLDRYDNSYRSSHKDNQNKNNFQMNQSRQQNNFSNTREFTLKNETLHFPPLVGSSANLSNINPGFVHNANFVGQIPQFHNHSFTCPPPPLGINYGPPPLQYQYQTPSELTTNINHNNGRRVFYRKK